MPTRNHFVVEPGFRLQHMMVFAIKAWLPSLVILENVRGLGHRHGPDDGKVPLDSVMPGLFSALKLFKT